MTAATPAKRRVEGFAAAHAEGDATDVAIKQAAIAV